MSYAMANHGSGLVGNFKSAITEVIALSSKNQATLMYEH